MHLINQTQRRKSAKFLILEKAEYTEEALGSVSFAFSKIVALRFCVSAFINCLFFVLLQRFGRIQAAFFEQPFDIGTFATEVDVHIHCVIDAARSQDIPSQSSTSAQM